MEVIINKIKNHKYRVIKPFVVDVLYEKGDEKYNCHGVIRAHCNNRINTYSFFVKDKAEIPEALKDVLIYEFEELDLTPTNNLGTPAQKLKTYLRLHMGRTVQR